MSILDILHKAQNAQNMPSVKKGSKALPVSIDSYTVKTTNRGILEYDLTLACIDAIAKNCAKVSMQAVIKKEGLSTPDTTSDVAKVLKNPNPYMTSYDFLYKVVAMLLSSDNCFIYPEYDQAGNLLALWPISYQTFQLYIGTDGRLYAKFQLNYLRTYTCPYEALIHLRQHYIDDDLFGDSHGALKPVCSLIEAQDQGIIAGIKNSAMIRGILKSVGVIKESDLIKARDQFVKDNLSVQNSGGVITVDGKFDYKQIESKPYSVDAETMAQAKRKVLDYFHISEAFLESSYTSEEYEATYESVLEPLILCITQALTSKLYTERELAFGNMIEAEVSMIKFQPMTTIKEIIQATSQLGLFTRDEYREMLGYAPLGSERGGNEIMIATNNYKSDSTQKSTSEDKDDE